MSELSPRQILVAAGDYQVLDRTRTALDGLGFAIRGTYSHRDALYMLEKEPVDLVVIDGAMFDRMSGDYTIQVMAATKDVPIIVFASAEVPTSYAQPPVEMVIGSLDEQPRLPVNARRGVPPRWGSPRPHSI